MLNQSEDGVICRPPASMTNRPASHVFILPGLGVNALKKFIVSAQVFWESELDGGQRFHCLAGGLVVLVLVTLVHHVIQCKYFSYSSGRI